jgi:hypothetical protein
MVKNLLWFAHKKSVQTNDYNWSTRFVEVCIMYYLFL